MKYFLGIVPNGDIYHQIQEFRRRVNEKHFNHIEAHITLKAPLFLGDPNTWLPALRQVCQKTAPLTVRLGPPQFFGHDAVLYLTVHGEGLPALHRQLLSCLRPFERGRDGQRRHEGDDYHPHLTLAMRSFGVSAEEMKRAAEEASRSLASFPPFLVSSVRVYRQAGRGQPWRPFMDLPLGAKGKEEQGKGQGNS